MGTKILTLLALAAAFSAAPARADELPAAPKCGDPSFVPTSIAATHRVPEYPPQSVSKNETGVAVLRVLIGMDGAPVSVAILKSSGFDSLDATAAKYVKENWRWEPLPQKCAPAGFGTEVTVRWATKDVRHVIDFSRFMQRSELVAVRPEDFPAGSFEKKEKGVTAVLAFVPKDGKIVETHVIASSDHPDLDARAEELVKSRYAMSPVMRDGAAMESWVILAVDWNEAVELAEINEIMKKMGLPPLSFPPGPNNIKPASPDAPAH